MAIKLKPKAATLVEKKTKGQTVLETHTEETPPGELLTFEPVAEVGMMLGTTINTGNYESVRCEVSIKMPCKASEIDETYDIAKAWVDNRLNELVQEIKE